MKRPSRVHVRPYVWLNGDRRHPGIGVLSGPRILAHLNADQARHLADQLHDLADDLDRTNPEPTTDPR